MKPLNKIVIVGLGLIGGSMARAINRAGLAKEVWAVGRSVETLEQAKTDGVIDRWSQDPGEYCAGADMIVLSVPGLTVESALAKILPFVEETTIISDVASVKSSTVEAGRKFLGRRIGQLVPGHPIAGSEQSGYQASVVDLFDSKRVILTPLPENTDEDVERVKNLWQSIGAEVLSMTVDYHDSVLAATSHLPHLLAFALVDCLSQHGESEEIFRYAAGGFRDFTRIASSDPQMWSDIFVANGKPTIRVLDEYIEELKRLRVALEDSDDELFLDTFSRAKQSRDKFTMQFEKNGNKE